MSEPHTAAASEEPQSKPHVETANNVEMTDLQSQSTYATPAEEYPPSTTAADTAPPLQTQPHLSPDSTSRAEGAKDHDEKSEQQQTAASSVSGVEPIGPSTTATTVGSETAASGPSIHITLLLTTGARHPYKIDPKYLRKRNVEAENADPFNISVYTLKELIWRDWRAEWEPRPSSPAYIRLINMGRMLDDKSALKGMH